MYEREIVHDLRETVRMLMRSFGVLERNEASCCGATLGQCHAIVEIGRAGAISLNELAELLKLDNSTMSRTVNNLVEQGYAVREADKEDRRYVKILLTEKGVSSYKSIEIGMQEYFEEILGAIPEEKHEQVLESLKLLEAALKGKKCC
ncbi:MAG: MarR family winged helix-turn-helix transcriptional regulator [Caulobacteraceae bacterium]